MTEQFSFTLGAGATLTGSGQTEIAFPSATTVSEPISLSLFRHSACGNRTFFGAESVAERRAKSLRGSKRCKGHNPIRGLASNVSRSFMIVVLVVAAQLKRG
jgi:hypothetical protein